MAQIFGHGLHVWLGYLTLGFLWEEERICSMITKIAQGYHLKARWTHSSFYPHGHLIAIFAPSTGLEDIFTPIETLTEFTQQALNDS